VVDRADLLDGIAQFVKLLEDRDDLGHQVAILKTPIGDEPLTLASSQNTAAIGGFAGRVQVQSTVPQTT
jgi:hypothetical protein